ncbi:MAG TPA: hypothetical protein VE244_12710 [Nitrososphaeraceae archaeon]|nr:hypothetical protein [Nitrososphaeraceae archaeon]
MPIANNYLIKSVASFIFDSSIAVIVDFSNIKGRTSIWKLFS